MGQKPGPSPQSKAAAQGAGSRKQSVSMVTSAAATRWAKSAGALLLLLSLLHYLAHSQPAIDFSNVGCEECTLRRNSFFSRERPIFQCMGCCFSRAYPTPLKALRTMTIRKNITSEATCCVAKHSYETEVSGIRVRNHTECHCSTCYFHKI